LVLRLQGGWLLSVQGLQPHACHCRNRGIPLAELLLLEVRRDHPPQWDGGDEQLHGQLLAGDGRRVVRLQPRLDRLAFVDLAVDRRDGVAHELAPTAEQGRG